MYQKFYRREKKEKKNPKPKAAQLFDSTGKGEKSQITNIYTCRVEKIKQTKKVFY